MELKHDAKVMAANGDDVGRVDRVVLDPKTNEVTGIVVRKGWLFSEDKVVPIGMVQFGDDGGVMLRGDTETFNDLQDYQSKYYVPADELNEGDGQTSAVAPVYAYPPLGVPWGGFGYGPAGASVPPDVVQKTETNIADNEVALKNGAAVLSRTGDHIGNIDEVLTNEDTRRVTHFVLSQGVIFKSRKLIPMDWVANVADDEVRLAVSAKTLEQVSDYAQA